MELISFSKYRKKAPIYKAKKGDKEALLALIDENRLNIYRVAKGILINEEDIRDAIQNTIIKTFESINTLKKDEYFQTWLIRILINECNETLRKNKKVVLLDDDIGKNERHNDNYENMDLIRAINSLSEDLRVTITLYYFDDISVKDIANILQISEGTVKSRLNRGRTKLKEILGEEE